MSSLSRRDVLKLTVGAAAVGGAVTSPWWYRRLAGAPQISSSEHAAMDGVADAFMRRFDVPGLAVTIADRGAIIYEQAFGTSDRETQEAVASSSLFRIASISKPITSVGIFKLIEKGKLNLNDAVFGTGAILGTTFGTPPYKAYIEDIRVDHLLTHTAGGWPNDPTDPMFRFPQMSQAELITWTLDNLPLEHPPGLHYAYSNFGYCVLGRVIEKIAQMPYADYIRQEVLQPCGIDDMRIGGNTLVERAPQEVTYYGQSGEDPYAVNVARMDSNGGWLASATDLVHFAVNITGVNGHPGLLRPESVVTMLTPSDADASGGDVKYARGWNVRDNGRGNWWHIGSLPGTTSVLARTSGGFCWAALINTRRQPMDEINLALDQMVWDMVHQVKSWKPQT